MGCGWAGPRTVKWTERFATGLKTTTSLLLCKTKKTNESIYVQRALCILLPKDCFFAPMGDICNTCLVSMTFNPFIFDGLVRAGRARPGWASTILLCMGSRWAGLSTHGPGPGWTGILRPVANTVIWTKSTKNLFYSKYVHIMTLF